MVKQELCQWPPGSHAVNNLLPIYNTGQNNLGWELLYISWNLINLWHKVINLILKESLGVLILLMLQTMSNSVVPHSPKQCWFCEHYDLSNIEPKGPGGDEKSVMCIFSAPTFSYQGCSFFRVIIIKPKMIVFWSLFFFELHPVTFVSSQMNPKISITDTDLAICQYLNHCWHFLLTWWAPRSNFPGGFFLSTNSFPFLDK